MSVERKREELHRDYGKAHLTAKDFIQCREDLSGIIVAPFDSSKAKGIGYNFSLSEMIYSITQKRLVPICREAQETYFYLQPHDTVLALSYEYLKVDDYIAGDFHSRVRMTAQGVGSTSTTLDPGWKGMLLFSLNNPTRKKIKILLSTRADGMVKQHSILTLVAWRTAQLERDSGVDKVDEYISLHLDNPPMRIDIWSELAAKPLRLFRNREYQQFITLVDSIASFDAKPSSYVSWADSLRGMLKDLCIAIGSQKNEESIRTALINIQSVDSLPDSMKIRLNNLTSCITDDSVLSEGEDLVTYCSKPAYQKKIELSKREIQYLVLCDQIRQIHENISQKVPTSWHKNLWANVWHYCKKYAGVILATLYFVFLMILGRVINNLDYWQELVLAFVPIIVSVILYITIDKK